MLAKFYFYRHGIQELAAQCHDVDTLDLVYKLLAESTESPPPLQLRTARAKLGQRVEDLDEYQARLVLSFVENLFRPEARTPEGMEVAA